MINNEIVCIDKNILRDMKRFMLNAQEHHDYFDEWLYTVICERLNDSVMVPVNKCDRV